LLAQPEVSSADRTESRLPLAHLGGNRAETAIPAKTLLHQGGAPLQEAGLDRLAFFLDRLAFFLDRLAFFLDRLAFFLDRAHAGNRNTKLPSLWKNNACICVEKSAVWKP
jgi:hypothetical protein